ncbi:MAG: LLM class F420-dependent oxidoreductase [Solirubrobacterales bacterium]|nr:LLM class F420-dependent oxidoreductase [Solirubrobacterales bacterium]
MSFDLTRYGVWTTYNRLGEQNAGEAARTAEQLGYGTLWLGGSPPLHSIRPLLEGSSKLLVGTSIVNVWHYPDPAVLADEFHALERDFPGRVILGLGVSHPEAVGEYQKPLAKLRSFLDQLASVKNPVPADRIVTASLGPLSLKLSGERTGGTIPYFVTPDHTRFARERVGQGKLVAPELAVVVDEDPARGRKQARDYAKFYLTLSNYTNNLKRFGFSDEDIADGGSDRLVDAVVPHGSAEQLVKEVEQHLNAGADHVALQTVGVDGVPAREWGALARALGL